MLIFGLFSSVRGKTPTLAGGRFRYDENAFQDYADAQYAAEFGSSDAYEDNLLITVLVEDEDYYDFCYIAWVGDHVAADINLMMGSSGTALGQAMDSCINGASYKYSLDSNLAQVVALLTEQIHQLDLDSSFSCDEDHTQVISHLTNHSQIGMNEETVNTALAAFTDATGIPAVIVVEDMDEVFTRSGLWASLGLGRQSLGAAVAVALTAFIGFYRARKRKMNVTESDDSFEFQ